VDGPVAPPPPPGPGVQPPFVAPPTDGSRQRRWVAIGLGIGAAVLLCVAGVAALGGLVVLGTQMLREQARDTVAQYLTGLRDGDWDKAYGELCDDLQEVVSPQRFAAEQAALPRVESFEVGEPDLATEPFAVPATVSRTDGAVVDVDYLIWQDPTTGGFEVCGEAD
jgi:hypothetical protein